MIKLILLNNIDEKKKLSQISATHSTSAAKSKDPDPKDWALISLPQIQPGQAGRRVAVIPQYRGKDE
ncbi:hypothetical protein D1AOALGA4SA_4184 [Olavius algarvensis Delta 1 endosymbiont]|nr:hypothetical protein D1AOALGA4SA_4184 [Olavius algarvensis Delta 1 endosymbiont]